MVEALNGHSQHRHNPTQVVHNEEGVGARLVRIVGAC
jgi:hypothetical protein